MESSQETKKILLHEGGKIYFSKETERKLFFILTIVMLIAGICSKIGLF
jgi:hypothetical protein